MSCVEGGESPWSHRHSDGQMSVAEEEDSAGPGPAETGEAPPVHQGGAAESNICVSILLDMELHLLKTRGLSLPSVTATYSIHLCLIW